MTRHVAGRPRGTGAVALLLSAAAIAVALSLPATAVAQDAPARDSLRLEVERLRAELDSLLAVVRGLEQGQKATPADPEADDPLAALRAAAAAAAGGGSGVDPADTASTREATSFVGRERSLQALNPELTVTGDFLAAVNLAEPGQDNFIPRALELSLQSALDPYSRAKIFLGRHAHGAGLVPFEDEHDHHHEEGEFEVEEAYVEWVNLPGGLGVSLGKFRQRFGQLNRWHAHSLPGQQLPLPYMAFFGEDGLAQTGVSLHWLTPVQLFGGTYEVWTQFARSSNASAFGEARGLSALAHFNAFYDLNRSTYLELGFTGLTGPAGVEGGRFGTRVGGFDFALSWRPPERSRYREFTLRGGGVYGRLAGHPDEVQLLVEGSEPEENAFGGFLIGEYRLNERWVVGARYEYTENPAHREDVAWLVAPTLTWWQSEYVRIRAEFDFLRRPDGILRQLVLQTTVSMGPHKHENY